MKICVLLIADSAFTATKYLLAGKEEVYVVILYQ